MTSTESKHKDEEATPPSTAPLCGVWIDGREAVIIRLEAGAVSVRSLKNDQVAHKAIKGLKHRGTRSGTHFISMERSELGSLRKEVKEYTGHVIPDLVGAGRIIVFGPAGMKLDLEKRIANDLPDTICEQMTTGPMSRNQKVAWVKRYFAKNTRTRS